MYGDREKTKTQKDDYSRSQDTGGVTSGIEAIQFYRCTNVAFKVLTNRFLK